MTSIMPYTFPATGAPVRVVEIDGEPWFVAGDVTEILGYANGRMAIGSLPERMRGSVTLADGTPGNPNRTVLSESGVYRLVMRSTLAGAEAFQDWLAEEVIPSIRRTGAYAPAPAPEMTKLEALQAAIESEQGRLAAEARAAKLAPAAAAWDRLASADADYSVREAAHILNRDPHIDTGERRLFAVLRGLGLVDRQDRPYQRHAQHVRLRPRSYTNPATGAEAAARAQLRVTTAGLAYLHKRLGGAASVQQHIAEHELDIPADGALFALPR
ncbi:BRO family protein [Streptomyces sp. CB03911]|uniref:phage antirepressor n=1 Tax=Streptomyces sp. CB03911 TaxID=1804758 RepID=UPI00093F5963|nr:BRO family protein [Streptomyces sp. CB03911]OKI22191.1 hypothetical protein A6A07_34515 [Streptomyces sp. CB03911]